MKQRTLKSAFSVAGNGLHSGLNIEASFNPAPENHGIKFERIDLEGSPIIEALAENVVDTLRGTVIGRGEARVSTIEHARLTLCCRNRQLPYQGERTRTSYPRR